MKRRRWKIYLAALCVSGIASVAFGEEPTLFRVFMRDGTALVSYGEVARVGSNAVFSMPTGASRIGIDTQLHLVNIPADQTVYDVCKSTGPAPPHFGHSLECTSCAFSNTNASGS